MNFEFFGSWLNNNNAWLAPLAAVVTIGLFAGSLIAFFWKKVNRGITWVHEHRPWKSRGGIPDTVVTFVPVPRGTFWHMGSSRDGKPAMQIVMEWYVTNASNVAVRFLDARLVRPNPRGRYCSTVLFIVLQNTAHRGVDMAIAPHQTNTFHVEFHLDPPTQERNMALIVEAIMTDQYGREHRTPKIPIGYDLPSAVLL